jgi:hypothetical protein
VSSTFAILEVSAATYAEIREKLVEAGYAHAVERDHESRECIDMHGLVVRPELPRDYRHYIFLANHPAGEKWNPFRPTPLGALREIYAWISNPAVVEFEGPPSTRGTLTYRADHHAQIMMMARRALGWDAFGEEPSA